MKKFRQLIQKTDPRLNVLIPQTLKQQLTELAKQGKRSFQDEIIKRLAATLAYNYKEPSINETIKANPTKLNQVIPQEIFLEIKHNANNREVSLDSEVTNRLYASLANPSAFGLNPTLDKLLNQKFSQKQAELEQNRKRKDWLRLYQKEKLKLYVEFEKYLPKNFKENFLLEKIEHELKALRTEKAKKEEKDDIQ